MTSRLPRLGLAIGLALAVCACADLPPAVEQPPSHAIASSEDTTLGRVAKLSSPDPELTGFRLIPNGDFALSARLELVRRAERALDVQYYQIVDDHAGRYFLRALRDAALRGVRVRLLVDDLYTSGQDELLLGLAAAPNVEVRLFNPFPAGRGSLLQRFAASLLDFGRVHRRMHNKLLIADGAMAIAGGRNIGSRYFRQAGDEWFLDIDAFVTGALLRRLGQLFDLYWNSDHVRPIGALAPSALARDELAHRFEQATGPPRTAPPSPPAPSDLLGQGPLATELEGGRLALIWARAEAFADGPDRVVGRGKSYGGVPLLDVDSVRYNVREQMRRARSEVTMVSPYLIPGETGMEVLREMKGRGVRIGIVTNSLAATDEPLVYAAYRRYRAAMLGIGAEIWEVGSDRVRRSAQLRLFGARTGRLHAKTAVFDGRTLYLGSMNLDPRSDIHNTELGLLIFDPTLAGQVSQLVDLLKEQGAYHVRLASGGSGVEWVSAEGVLKQEPDTDWWSRLRVRLLQALIPEGLL